LFSFAKPGSSARSNKLLFQEQPYNVMLEIMVETDKFYSNFAFTLFKINVNKIVATSQAIIYKIK